MAVPCLFAIFLVRVFSENPIADENPKATGASESPDFDAKLRSLAGADAIYCGHVGLRESSRAANECASKAFKEKRAFYVRYDVSRYRSSYVSVGLAQDMGGRMYQIRFADVIFLPHVDSGRSSNPQTVASPCPPLTHLVQGKDGGIRHSGPEWQYARAPRLSCFPFGK